LIAYVRPISINKYRKQNIDREDTERE